MSLLVKGVPSKTLGQHDHATVWNSAGRPSASFSEGPKLAGSVRSPSWLTAAVGQPTLEWVGTVDGVEKVYDSDPGVSFGTRLQLLLLFPFVSESQL
jgi:hypothetical protein